MKIRELIDKITDKTRYGHLMILFFSDLDKDIEDVIRDHQSLSPEYVDHLRRIMKEFGVKEETMPYEDKDINSEFVHITGEKIDRIVIKSGKVFLYVPTLAKPKEIASGIELILLYATTPEGSKHVLGIREGELFINEYGFYIESKEDSINALKLYIAI